MKRWLWGIVAVVCMSGEVEASQECKFTKAQQQEKVEWQETYKKLEEIASLAVHRDLESSKYVFALWYWMFFCDDFEFKCPRAQCIEEVLLKYELVDAKGLFNQHKAQLMCTYGFPMKSIYPVLLSERGLCCLFIIRELLCSESFKKSGMIA